MVQVVLANKFFFIFVYAWREEAHLRYCTVFTIWYIIQLAIIYENIQNTWVQDKKLKRKTIRNLVKGTYHIYDLYSIYNERIWRKKMSN